MSERKVSRQRAWQLRKQAQGLCIHCGKRPICADSKNFCAQDRRELNARRRTSLLTRDEARV